VSRWAEAKALTKREYRFLFVSLLIAQLLGGTGRR
jgi:hypothetical protein